ncbi:MAG: hypothetical protein KatS3mg035_0873 [Bacteroidia bacterium]|nr:MAG: hypothetical protein KatS3mg035_0873 [Bacteroidia bacterium]
MKKVIFFLGLFLFFTIDYLSSQNLDVLHYDLNLTIKNFTQKNIQGNALIRYDLKQNTDSIFFELNKLVVDSVVYHQQKLNFSQRGDSLWIQFPSILGPQLDSITIYYSGEPGKDSGNLGGFYFQDSTYAFNIGVSYYNDPHNFGKAWFPCRDNFLDKATYTFHIEVDSGMTAVCGGLLYQIDTLNNGSLVYHWNVSTPISTYLASVAVAKYQAIEDTVWSINNQVIPIAIYALPTDTSKVRGTFANLKDAFHIYENLFGAFRFERIGYVAVPFSAGAMEHAGNIAFPRNFISGTTFLDNIMVHELAHNWFGNLVTCDYQENMWLNEGWANYCEPLFFEFFQDKKAYKDYVRGLQEDVLRRAHILDESYLPLTPMPANHTYGTTTYKKGAIVIHTLRNYLGDSLFFGASKHYLNKYAFENASTEDFQLAFEEFTNQNLTPFIEGWVKSPGFVDFDLDSFRVSPSGSQFQTQIFIRQRLKQKPNFIQTKLPIALWSKNWQRKDTVIIVNGEFTNTSVVSSFEPVLIMLDPEETLADVTVEEYKVTKNVASLAFDKSYGSVSVVKIPAGDSALVRFIHHFIKPEGDQPEKGIYLTHRYWEIQMLHPDTGFEARAVFRYNGGTSGTTGYIDIEGWNTHEDSLVLLYKEKMSDAWQIWDSTVHQKGNPNDKIGSFEARKIRNGFFAIGYKDTVQTINRPKFTPSYFLKVYPNPAQRQVFLSTNLPVQEAWIEIYHSTGQKVLRVPFQSQISLDLPSGLYFLQVKNSEHSITQKLVVSHE